MLGPSYSFLVAKSLELISIEELLLSVSVVVETGRKGKEIGARKKPPELCAARHKVPL